MGKTSGVSSSLVARVLMLLWIGGCYAQHEDRPDVNGFVDLWSTAKWAECGCSRYVVLPSGDDVEEPELCRAQWLEGSDAERYRACLERVLTNSTDGIAIIDCYEPGYLAYLECLDGSVCPSEQSEQCARMNLLPASRVAVDRQLCVRPYRDTHEELRECLSVFR